MEIVSLVVSIVSVVLGIFAIQHKSELIDRSVRLQQQQLIVIINKALDKIGQPPIDMVPISLEEIDAILNENRRS